MKNNVSTPLSIILNIMNISSSKIARSIFVDQSLVSKWKNGERRLTPGNQYLHALVGVLLEENKNSGKLEDFFNEVYGISDSKDNNLENNLLNFLTQKELPVHLTNKAAQVRKTVYSSQFDVYGKINDVFTILFDKTEDGQHHTVYIHECRGFSYLTEDDDFYKFWCENMERLLDNGNDLVFIHEKVPDINKFLEITYSLRQHKNVTEYFPARSNSSFCSTYIATHALSALSFKNSFAVFSDNITLGLHEEAIKFMTEHISPVTAGKKNLYDNMSATCGIDETVYFYSSAPCFIHMPTRMLREILSANKQNNECINNCIKYTKAASGKTCYCFLPIEAFDKHAGEERVRYSSFEPFTQKAVFLTKTQYKKHIKYLINKLREDNNLHICLAPQKYFDRFSNASHQATQSFWTTQNFWTFSMTDFRSKWYDDQDAVSASCDIFTDIYNKIPEKYKQKSAVADFLSDLL
ncbi:MAG: hypothetical protein FWD71_23745 [Oscillospiraceae bacterium]|nr:hypothetical protein [Oscillospiraceae bacterium]